MRGYYSKANKEERCVFLFHTIRAIANVSNCNWNVVGFQSITGEGNLHPHLPPREYLSEYTSQGKSKIPLVDRILMDPGHKARKNASDD